MPSYETLDVLDEQEAEEIVTNRVPFTWEEDVACVSAALEIREQLAATIARHGASSVVMRLANVLAIETGDGLPHGSAQLVKAYNHVAARRTANGN